MNHVVSRKTSRGLFGAAALLVLIGTAEGRVLAHDEYPATLTFLGKGAMQKAGGYRPGNIVLSSDKLEGITKEPTYTNKPLYGRLPYSKGTVVVLDESADGSVSKLYVDANHDGDLTNDPPIVWERRKQKLPNGAEVLASNYFGKTEIRLDDQMASVDVYHFAPDYAPVQQGKLPKNALFFYADFGYTGKLTLGGKSYDILVYDMAGTGKMETSYLFVDRDGDGKFNARYEAFPLDKPFNVGGTTYQFQSAAANGSRLVLQQSTVQVAEIPLPPSLNPGKPALAFSRKTLDGQAVSFPGDYKGKLVMLDFWATWCGPCIGELPGLTKAYEKYRSQGFEILGISLDQKDMAQKVQAFLKDKNMPWAQVYDGKYWEADIAKLYDVHAIPAAFLVDGNTGKIVASGNDLRGEKLDGTLAKALAAQKAANGGNNK